MTNMLVKEMYLGVGQFVYTVEESATLIEAFRLMKIGRITGVGVVDQHGHLLANVSVKDLKKISKSAKWISRLFHPLSDFIKDKEAVYGKQAKWRTKFSLSFFFTIFFSNPYFFT